MAATYSIVMDNATVVANATFIFLRAATAVTSRGSILEILRASATQYGTSTSQQLGMEIAQKVSAYGTYVTATPTNYVVGGPASGISGGTTGAAGTCGVNASAEGAGATTMIYEDGFNNLNGFLWVPTPEERIILPPDAALTLKLSGTPTTLTNWHAVLVYREIN